MKQLLLVLTSTVILLACNKSSVNSVKPNADIKAFAEQKSITEKSTFNLLTGNTWLYNKYYENYQDSAHPGTLVYKKGAKTNSLHLNLYRITFNKDQTVTEIDEHGKSLPGTWKFTDSAHLHVVVTNDSGRFANKTLLLSATKYNWVNVSSHVYAEMIPAEPVNPIAGNYHEEWLRWNAADTSGIFLYDLNFDTVTFTPTSLTEVRGISMGTGETDIIDFKNTNRVLSNFTVSFDSAFIDDSGVTITSGPVLEVADPVHGIYRIYFTYTNSTGAPRAIINIYRKF